MAGVSQAATADRNVRSDKAMIAARPLPRKVQSLVTKTGYAAPKVVSFPIDGMKVSTLTLAGNIG